MKDPETELKLISACSDADYLAYRMQYDIIHGKHDGSCVNEDTYKPSMECVSCASGMTYDAAFHACRMGSAGATGTSSNAVSSLRNLTFGLTFNPSLEKVALPRGLRRLTLLAVTSTSVRRR